jgi:hypothetical protein
MRRKIVRVAVVSLQAVVSRATAYGGLKDENHRIFLCNYLLYNDLVNFTPHMRHRYSDTLPPAFAAKSGVLTPDFRLLDFFDGICKTIGYEDDEVYEYYEGNESYGYPFIPPPPQNSNRNVTIGYSVFNAIFALTSRIGVLRKISDYLSKFIPLPGVWRKSNIAWLVKNGYKPVHKTNKIAFVIVIDWIFSHLEKVISSFKNDEYDIVYIRFSEVKCKNYARIHNSNVLSIQEVIKHKSYYNLAVITHAGLGDGDKNYNYGIEMIASKIMFVASLIDFDYCNLINMKPFNYIVCANEYQKKQFEEVISCDKLFVLGLPRQNVREYNRETSIEIIRRHTGCNIDVSKKTLLWLPTHTKTSSAIKFAPIIAKLQNEFNIIEKPHPFLYYENKNFYDFMKKIIPEIIIINDIDNIKLIPAADFVVCDYGGSVFYAVLADKNVILLNTPSTELDGASGQSVPSNVIRSRIVNFYPDEEEKFFAALKDDSVWEKQKEIRKEIRAEFFTENLDPARDIAELCRRIVRGEL